MYFLILLLVTQAINTTSQLDTNLLCLKAKTCIHNGNEKCGLNDSGYLRRFLDSCDLLEYNCVNHVNYTTVPYEKCAKLPPIGSNNTKTIKENYSNEDTDGIPNETNLAINPADIDSNNSSDSNSLLKGHFNIFFFCGKCG